MAEVARLSAAKRRDKIRREQAKADLAAVMSTPAGRRFVWGVLDHCRINGSTLPPDGWMAVREGERSVGVWLQEWLFAACAKQYAEMFTEAWAERKTRALIEKDMENAGISDDDDTDE